MNAPFNNAGNNGRIGLVLGAGGSSGAHWIFGVLSGLRDRTGFQPQHAEVLIGTSIGAIKAAGMGPFSSPPQATIAALMAGASPPPRPGLRSGSLASMRLFAGKAIAVASRPGSTDPYTWVEQIEPQTSAVVCSVQKWPPARRAAAIAGSPNPAREIAASAAIPFGAQSVDIDGKAHIDGAVWSVTNADLASPENLDLLIVIAPLVASDGGSLVSSLGRHQLASELEPWRRARKPVIVMAPTGDQYARRQHREQHRADGYSLALNSFPFDEVKG